MIDHNILPPPEDIDSGGTGFIPTSFDQLPAPTPSLSSPCTKCTSLTVLSHVDLFDIDVLSSSKKDITSPNVSRAPCAHNDDPNSSLGSDIDIASLLTGDFDAPATPLIPDQGVATCGNQNPLFDDQIAEGFQDATHATGGILESTFDLVEHTPSDVITPAQPAPAFDDGVEAWTKLLERIGSGLDSFGLPGPAASATGPVLPGAGVTGLGFAKALNSDYVTATPPPTLSLNIGEQPDLFGLGTVPLAPLEVSVPPFNFDSTLGYVFVDPPLVPPGFTSPALSGYASASPPPDSPIPFLSPASTDSSGSQWSVVSNGSDLYLPLFPSVGLSSPSFDVGSPAILDSTSPPSSPALPGIGFGSQAEIDAYVDSLTKMRRPRGAGGGRSPVKLECPLCGKKERRPCELKEHMYADLGLALFRCSNEGCEHVFNRASNLTRHRNTCIRGRRSKE
ncbi:hypothetical protein FRC12_013618 [Ceratobasidium sp. 428]|nr:hypothetical protein FRC12_013618 [Ceratobasidium sp. 428]